MKTTNIYYDREEDINNNIDLDDVVIDEVLFHIEEYLEIIFVLMTLGITTFYIGGSRMSGKTIFITFFILMDMIKNRHNNGIVIMWNKTDHSTRTLQEFKDAVKILDDKGSGFEQLGEAKDSQTSKEYILRGGKNKQVIRFLGEDDIDKGTQKPPHFKGVGRGFWFEEPTGSEERGGVNEDKIRRMLDKLTRLKGSLLRFFVRLSKEDQKKNQFITFFSFNPYNKYNKLIKNGVERHNDRIDGTELEQELEDFGYISTINLEDKEMYITTNYKVNPFLPDGIHEEYEKLRRNDYDFGRTEGLGIAGSPNNSIYQSIGPTIEKYNRDIRRLKGLKPDEYNEFVIGIDVGSGGDGETAISLCGKRQNPQDGLKEQGDYLDGEGGNGRQAKTSGKKVIEQDKVIFEILDKIKKGETKYKKMKNKEVRITFDNDKNFYRLFLLLYKDGYSQGYKYETRYNLRLMTEKYNQGYHQSVRANLFLLLFQRKQFRIGNTKYGDSKPDLHFIQGQQAEYEINKFVKIKQKDGPKVKGGNDDRRQATEIAMAHIIKPLIRQIPSNEIPSNLLNILLNSL